MAIERPVKRGNVRQFDESYQRGFKTAWASEVDADFNLLYDTWNNGNIHPAPGSITELELADNSVDSRHIKDFAVKNTELGAAAVTRDKTNADLWLPPIPDFANGDVNKVLTVAAGPTLVWQIGSGVSNPPTGPAGGDLFGFYPDPTVKAFAKSKWNTDTFPYIEPNDTSKTLHIPAINSVAFGPGPRLGSIQSEDVTAEFSLNDPWAPQDLATSSWAMQISSPADTVSFIRRAPGAAAGVVTSPFVVANGILRWGGETSKGRLTAASGVSTWFSNAATTGAIDDTAKAAWQINLSAALDNLTVYRSPPGTTTLWAKLLTLDYLGNVRLIPGSNLVVNDTGLIMGRFTASTNGGVLSYNTPAIGSSTWDHVSQPRLVISLDGPQDKIAFLRAAAGSGTLMNVFSLTGAGDLTIAGPDATKSAGTVWINPSDTRLKRDIVPYNRGLSEIQALAPIMFQFNGLGDTVDDGRMCYGLDAAAVQAVMPECVSTRRAKLQPDDKDDTELLLLDASNITWALINAVQELATRVGTLEAR